MDNGPVVEGAGTDDDVGGVGEATMRFGGGGICRTPERPYSEISACASW